MCPSGRSVPSADVSERAEGPEAQLVGKGRMWGDETTMSVGKVGGRRAGVRKRRGHDGGGADDTGGLVNPEFSLPPPAHPPPGTYLSVIALYYLLLVSILLSTQCCSSPFLPL